MGTGFGLSFVAVDVLLERLGLGASPFPFEVPRFGLTLAERERTRAAVVADLGRRGLADEAVAAMRLFAKPLRVITAFGKLDGGPLVARVCAGASRAVKAVGVGDAVQFEFVRPTALVAAAVGLLPVERAGVGHSVTFAQAKEAGLPRGTATAELARARVMMRREKVRLGQFGVAGANLFWYDTAVGRYVVTSRVGRDGQLWTTISPADNGRIGQLLESMVDG